MCWVHGVCDALMMHVAVHRQMEKIISTILLDRQVRLTWFGSSVCY